MARSVKTSERLLEKLRRELPELEIPEGARLERAEGSYSGDDRAQGAWVWRVVCAGGAASWKDPRGRYVAIGSQWTMTELVRLGVEAHREPHGDIAIDPPAEMQRKAVRS